MSVNSELTELVIRSYKELNFVQKAKHIFRFTNIENRLTSFDKNEILKILDAAGYNFKFKQPGNELISKDLVENVEFVTSFNIKGGVILPYLYVYVDGNKIPYDYPGFVFTYKFLINDFETLMSPGTVYTSYNDFSVLVMEILAVYKEFKQMFIKNYKN